ncbi:MAG: tRNA (adenosine(37)-N6)-threonylcarbamoyltransferase complex ATPase subunit type 1 TsaE [Balneolaceae bacterium]
MEKKVSRSEEETMQIAAGFAQKVNAGDIICLQGELGSGKTHFVKGFVRAFGIDSEEVRSPTYTLINEYLSNPPIYHFDCYRIEDPMEAIEFGAEEYFYGNGVCVIEWPERIKSILPDTVQTIIFETTGENSRTIIFEASN